MNTDLDQSSESRTWAMILHLSVFAGYIVPMAGLIAPVVIWQVKKDQLPEIDAHGKVVMNAILSFILYTIVGVVLTIVLIGIPILIVVGIMAIVFPIIGAIKANNGELWKYPMTISFF